MGSSVDAGEPGRDAITARGTRGPRSAYACALVRVAEQSANQVLFIHVSVAAE
jgi:hypothetical protein